MAMAVFKQLNQTFFCRNDVLLSLTQLIGEPKEVFPAAIYIYGQSGTGKTAITKEFLRLSKKHQNLCAVHINCVEAYTSRLLYENILEDLLSQDLKERKKENLKEFIETLRQADTNLSYVVVLDAAERLRDMDANILPAFLRLAELTGLNICCVLISQLPFEKFYCKTGLGEVLTLFFPQYTKQETQTILTKDIVNAKRALSERLQQTVATETEKQHRKQVIDSITPEFYGNYLNLYLSVFFKACRDVPELKLTARKCFVTYMEPVLDGSIDANDVSRLWRNIAGSLRKELAQVYMRYDRTLEAVS